MIFNKIDNHKNVFKNLKKSKKLYNLLIMSFF